MFRVIDCDEDLIYFQEDLDKLHQWSQRNQMDFNTKKCKIMRITRKQVPFTNSVQMNDTILEEVKEFKDRRNIDWLQFILELSYWHDYC